MTQVLQHEIGEHIKCALHFDVAKASLPEGQVEVIVSSPREDRQGDRININGIDTSTMADNAPVMWAHDYTTAPIGRIIKLWKSAGNLKARVEFALGLNAFADEIYAMVKAGFIKAVSIGGIVQELGKKQDGSSDMNYIDKMEMIELSFCPIGANADALVTLKSLESNIIKTGEDYTIDAIGDMIKSLQTQVSALASSHEAVRVPERQTIKRQKIVLAKSATKNVDKGSELIISAYNSLLEDKNGRRKNRDN